MAGLVLTLEPHERVLINGALLENGEKPSKIRLCDRDTRVLRCRDALHPNEVTTPVRRVYFAIQLLITGDLRPEDTMAALLTECSQLEDVFEPVLPGSIALLVSMIERDNYYSALCHLRPLLQVEAELLGTHAGTPARAVA